MTDKERLEEIKELVKKIESILYDEWRQQELASLIESLYYDDHVDWLIEQAGLLQRFAKKNAELNVFLNKYIKPKHLGKNVIDVAMDIIEKQSERVQELGKLSDNLKHELFSVRIERDLLKEEVKALKKSVNFLEKQRERIGNSHQQTIKDAGLLLKQNQRYKQALEFYADEKNHEREWDTFTDSGVEKSEVMKDGGEKARKALKGE